MLVILNEKLKTSHKEKTDLERKLIEDKAHYAVDIQTVQALENRLILVNDKLSKLNETQLVNIDSQNEKAKLCAKEVDILKMNLIKKDEELQLCEIEKNKILIDFKNRLSTVEKNLSLEKQKFLEKR